MFAFRRAAARAFASPSLSVSIKSIPRNQSIRAYSLFASSRQQPVSSSICLQRRFASDDSTSPAETRGEPAADGEVFHQESEVDNAAARSENEATFGESVAQAATRTQQAVEESGAPQVVQDAAAAVTGAATRAATGGEPAEGTQIFIGNLFYHVDEEALRKQFEQYGTVVKSKVTRDPRGLSKGFGFIAFENPESASKAIADSHNKMFEGRMIVVQPANGRSTRRAPTSGDLNNKPRSAPTRTLWIGNLSYDMTDNDLNSLFRPLKNVLDVRVAIDRRTGQARGFAHADFVDVASATEALEFLEQQTINGRRLKLDYGATYRNGRQE